MTKEIDMDNMMNEETKEYIDKADETQMIKSVTILDIFMKTYCRYLNDYSRFGDLKFRCGECPFATEDGKCLCKAFKAKYAPYYRDFGSMCDH